MTGALAGLVACLLVMPAASAPAAAPALVADALAGIPRDEPRMESYAHGNYALSAAGFAWSIAVLLLMLGTGLGPALQGVAARCVRGRSLQAAITAALVTLVSFVAGLPLQLYSGYWRERRYGFMNQPLAAWLGDRVTWLLIAMALQSIGVGSPGTELEFAL